MTTRVATRILLICLVIVLGYSCVTQKQTKEVRTIPFAVDEAYTLLTDVSDSLRTVGLSTAEVPLPLRMMFRESYGQFRFRRVLNRADQRSMSAQIKDPLLMWEHREVFADTLGERNLEVSTPLISRNGNVVVFSVQLFRHRNAHEGWIFIMIREDDQWTVRSGGRWVH